ncbi:MAG TPA: DUF72 domain-containing protein [Gemmatimonadales bacterium]|nr:DUF72 domain-containing protein [Gemmatimonadales bacterium]
MTPEAAGVDPRHDPGVSAARERAERVPLASATIVRAGGAGGIRVGTAGWTDRTLTAPGVFYPAGVTTPRDRLAYYASRFPLVEVDAPFYALPTREQAELWVSRTPPDFVFDVKAFALLTGHPTEATRLPRDLVRELPEPVRQKGRIYARDLPGELLEAVWERFLDALAPLEAAGKLGVVLFQYPRWFLPNRGSEETLLDVKRRLERAGYTAAIEFRNRRWMEERLRERTLGLLEAQRLPYVMVDEPQGLESSVPPVVAVTSPRFAVLRMHGRRADVWEKPNVTVAERYRYLYDRDQLADWVPKVAAAAKATREVHVVYNNCYANYGTTNALEFTQLLLAAGAPPPSSSAADRVGGGEVVPDGGGLR